MIKHVTEVDSEFINRLDSKLERIERALENHKMIPQKNMLTSDEFMARIKMSRWKFRWLLSEGKMKFKKIGRKYFIPESEVSRFFDGELG